MNQFYVSGCIMKGTCTNVLIFVYSLFKKRVVIVKHVSIQMVSCLFRHFSRLSYCFYGPAGRIYFSAIIRISRNTCCTNYYFGHLKLFVPAVCDPSLQVHTPFIVYSAIVRCACWHHSSDCKPGRSDYCQPV